MPVHPQVRAFLKIAAEPGRPGTTPPAHVDPFSTANEAVELLDCNIASGLAEEGVAT